MEYSILTSTAKLNMNPLETRVFELTLVNEVAREVNSTGGFGQSSPIPHFVGMNPSDYGKFTDKKREHFKQGVFTLNDSGFGRRMDSLTFSQQAQSILLGDNIKEDKLKLLKGKVGVHFLLKIIP